MMVMPSGRRSSEPRPGRDHQRQRAEQRRERRHQDRPEALQAGLVDRLLRRQPALALGFEREVDHHDAVLLHDADQQDDADQARSATVRCRKICSASSAPRPADGSVEMIVSGMREALVEHAEHDIDRDQRRQDQQRLRADRLRDRRGRRPANSARMVSGRCSSATARSTAPRRLLDGDVRRQAEADGHRRELALVVDHQRLQAALDPARPRCSGTCAPSAPGT